MTKGPYLGPCAGWKWFQLARRRAKKKIFFAQCNDQHTVHKLLRYQAKNIATDTGDFSLSNKNLAKLSQHFPYLLVMNQLSNYILFGLLKAFSLFVVFLISLLF